MDMKNSYWRFGAMIITSMIVMFGLMYLNTYANEFQIVEKHTIFKEVAP